jgi:2-polyprenyl-3-methyl-5-hydroxy-6-metoxy-1,4-benzoquinol methylase
MYAHHVLFTTWTYRDVTPAIDGNALTDDLIRYLETQLQASERRFDAHIRIVDKFGPLDGKRILDIGCGGGLFLTKARELNAVVMGIELDDGRAAYCKYRHNLDIVKYPIEDEFWERHYGTFDFVTLWDVLEHVNFPLATIQAASRLLKEGGVLVLDTPARDSFYHRVGILTYRLSFGYFPTFLNAIYSAHPYGHKQILSTFEVAKYFEQSNLETVDIDKFHELSFPYEFYLQRMLRSTVLARLAAPIASVFFSCFRIRNKMVAVGRNLRNSDAINARPPAVISND